MIGHDIYIASLLTMIMPPDLLARDPHNLHMHKKNTRNFLEGRDSSHYQGQVIIKATKFPRDKHSPRLSLTHNLWDTSLKECFTLVKLL